MALVCNAYQLLPGGPCPDYAYRYLALGTCELPRAGSWSTALLVRLQQAERPSSQARSAAEKLEKWIRATAERLQRSHRSGWEPHTGVCFVLESPGAAAKTWDWDLHELALVRRRYAQKTRARPAPSFTQYRQTKAAVDIDI